MTGSGLNLLVLNWQDLENPLAGGAEIHLTEIFGRLVGRGHRVTLLCSGWEDAEPVTRVAGIETHRVGGRYTYALRAPGYYRSRLRSRAFDLIVEDINKVPLFSPLWVSAPVVALVPHLFGTTAFREASAALAAAVWLAERPVPRIYRHVPFQAISQSTADDLVARGIDRSRITVIRPGIERSRFRPDPGVDRFETPTFVYIGRLKKYKGLEQVIDAVGRMRERGVSARFVVAGTGDHERRLRARAARRAPGAVEFRGYVSEDEKIDLLRRAWSTVYPSPKEGWGITNIEAAASGTPVVASDSPGLRESVSAGRSGLLVAHGDVEAWVEALTRLVREPELRRRLAAGAVEFAEGFSWDRAARETEAHFEEVITTRSERGTIGTGRYRVGT